MLAIITVVFFMMRAAPGNPYSAERMLTPAVEANLKASLGLDKPIQEHVVEDPDRQADDYWNKK